MRNNVKRLVEERQFREAMTALRTLPPEKAPQFVSIVSTIGLKAKEIKNVKERDEILIFVVTFIVTFGSSNMIGQVMGFLELISENSERTVSFKRAIESQLSIIKYAPIQAAIFNG